jgi:spermidine synthase
VTVTTEDPTARYPSGRLLVGLVFVTALAGILYELLLGTISSLLLGDATLEWCLTIGVFLFAMGVGSFLSRFFADDGLPAKIAAVQLAIAAVGGVAPVVLFAVDAFADGQVRFVLVVVLLALGAGIGLEIPLLTRMLRRHASLADALASALALDYVGALVASVAFPLALYPWLGLTRTAAIAGMLNVGAGAVLITYVSGARRMRLALRAGAFAVVVLLGGTVGTASRVMRAIESHAFGAEIVHTEISRYQHIVFTRDRANGDLRLYLQHNLQFSARDELRYHEALVHPVMTLADAPRSVLVLGGGDGLAVREILRHPSVRAVTLVDLDPAMTRLAREFAPLTRLNERSLHDPRVRIVHADAFAWMRRSAPGTFDAVVMDLPDPSTSSVARLYGREAFRLAAARLAPGGVLVTQATSAYYTREAFWSIERTVADAGLSTLPFHAQVPSFGEWGFVLAAHHRLVPPARLALPTQYFEPAALAAAFHFPPDLARVDAEPSTLADPHVLWYYAAAVRREQ